MSSVYLQDPDVTLWHGDVLETLRELPAESVHMACTSPPFYGLRDYGTGTWEGGDEGCDHAKPTTTYNQDFNERWGQGSGDRKQETKSQGQYRDACGKCGARRVDQQIGLEPTPDEWVARLVEVFRELRRVLRKDGTLWVEIGDSYNGLPRLHYGAQYKDEGRGLERREQLEKLRAEHQPVAGVKPKDLIGAPWLLAFAMRADGWYLRSEIIWSKPNPMPESVTDRPTTAHSRVFLFAKSKNYYYDAEAIREPHKEPERSNGKPEMNNWSAGGTEESLGSHETVRQYNPAGRNRRSVWEIPTQPYPEAHFATWPEKLCEPMILAGTSEKGVCPECEAPWERVVDATVYEPPVVDPGVRNVDESRQDKTRKLSGADYNAQVSRTTTGWQPTCACSSVLNAPTSPVPATVLDPFAGSGTTMYVARRLGRRSVGIDLSAEYLGLAAKRLAQQSLLAVES